jgi:hypothetical protein
MNHLNFPFALPFKFVPNTSSPGIHFDDSWACEQIKSFEAKAYYRQKWQLSDTTPLQIESSIAPEDLKMYNSAGTLIKSFEWTAVHSEVNYKIYECTFDISDKPEGVYWLYQRVNLLSIDWKAISEPIHAKASWPNTQRIGYKNSYNDHDVAWTTGIKMYFRCEMGIMDFTPERDRTAYANQTHDVATLKGVPSRQFKLYIGTAPGVAPYIVDILNRIFCCDYIEIAGKLYQSAEGSKWEVTRVKNYPLIGASIDIVPATNEMSLQFSDTTPLAPGIVTAFKIDTSFFGPGTLVPVTDVQEQS